MLEARKDVETTKLIVVSSLQDNYSMLKTAE